MSRRKPDAEQALAEYCGADSPPQGVVTQDWLKHRATFRRRLRALLRERAEMAQAAAVRSTGSIPLKRAPNDREWANFVLPIRAAVLNGRKP